MTHFQLPEKSIEEINLVISEILEGGAMPIVIGGTHINAYGILLALAEAYGPKTFAMVHFDAHYDAMPAGHGHYVHNGSFLHLAVEAGILMGSDIIQVGLRSSSPSNNALQWMQNQHFRYHFMAELHRFGFDRLMTRLLEETAGKKLFISVDMDAIDPAYAPAVGTQEPDGLTPHQILSMLRGLIIQNEVLAVEFCEYNPFMDDNRQTTGILVDRLIRGSLAGLSARKNGITDPLFLHPSALDHGQ